MEVYFDNSATTKVFDCVRDIAVSYTHLDVYKRQIFLLFSCQTPGG